MRNSSNSTNADSIRQRMEVVRCDMDDDMQEIVGDVRSYFDWRAHVRKSPWICLSAAFAAGYLVVPKKRSGKSLIPVRMISPPKQPPSTSLNQNAQSTLLTFVSNLALRGVSAYLENQAVRFAAACATKPKLEYHEEASLSKPLEEPEPKANSSTTCFSVQSTTR